MEGNSLLCDTHALLTMPGFNPTSVTIFFCKGFMGNRLNMCPMPHRSSELNELTGIKHLISIGFSILDKTSWTSFPHTPSEANCEPCMTGNVSSPPLLPEGICTYSLWNAGKALLSSLERSSEVYECYVPKPFT